MAKKPKTLWISILGFSSGRTGWVLTDQPEPYDKNERPVEDSKNGVVCRYDKSSKKLLKKAQKAAAIRVLSYDKSTSNLITYKQLEKALDPYTLLEDNLSDLMPEEPEEPAPIAVAFNNVLGINPKL